MILQASFCAPQLQVAVSLSRYYIPRFVQVQTAVVGSPLSVCRLLQLSVSLWFRSGLGAAGPVFVEPIVCYRFTHSVFVGFLYYFGRRPSPQVCLLSRLSVQVSSHSVNNPLYSSPDLLCCIALLSAIFFVSTIFSRPISSITTFLFIVNWLDSTYDTDVTVGGWLSS